MQNKEFYHVHWVIGEQEKVYKTLEKSNLQIKHLLVKRGCSHFNYSLATIVNLYQYI